MDYQTDHEILMILVMISLCFLYDYLLNIISIL